jgi:nitrate reductase NapD
MANDEYHVASYIVRARDADPAPRAAIAALPGVEIHAQENNRLIVTAEASHVGELAKTFDAMQSLPGVLAVSPVYHELFNENEGAGEPAAKESQDS